jgi:alpha-N-arabinofuranosidase
LLLGCLIITLLKNSDRVKIACLAQLVNVIAPIMTEEGGAAWRQTTFYPFSQAARYGHGTVLRSNLDVPVYDCAEYKSVPFLESVVIHNDKKNEIIIFAVNRSKDESIDFSAELQDFNPNKIIEFSEISNHDIKQTNTKDIHAVVPKQVLSAKIQNGNLYAALNPLSWNMIRVELK